MAVFLNVKGKVNVEDVTFGYPQQRVISLALHFLYYSHSSLLSVLVI